MIYYWIRSGAVAALMRLQNRILCPPWSHHGTAPLPHIIISQATMQFIGQGKQAMGQVGEWCWKGGFGGGVGGMGGSEGILGKGWSG